MLLVRAMGNINSIFRSGADEADGTNEADGAEYRSRNGAYSTGYLTQNNQLHINGRVITMHPLNTLGDNEAMDLELSDTTSLDGTPYSLEDTPSLDRNANIPSEPQLYRGTLSQSYRNSAVRDLRLFNQPSEGFSSSVEPYISPEYNRYFGPNAPSQEVPSIPESHQSGLMDTLMWGVDASETFADKDAEFIRSLDMNTIQVTLPWKIIQLESGRVNNDEVLKLKATLWQLMNSNLKVIIVIVGATLPEHLLRRGGFFGSDFSILFAKLAEIAFSRFGKFSKYWVTIQDPSSLCRQIHPNEVRRCVDSALSAHQSAANVLKTEYSQLGKITMGVSPNLAVSSSHRVSVLESLFRHNSEVAVSDEGSKGSEQDRSDFVYLNFDYNSFAEAQSLKQEDGSKKEPEPSVLLEMSPTKGKEDGSQKEPEPSILLEIIESISRKYSKWNGHPPEFIIADHGSPQSRETNPGSLHDAFRIKYYEGNLIAVSKAAAKNIPIIGYITSFYDSEDIESTGIAITDGKPKDSMIYLAHYLRQASSSACCIFIVNLSYLLEPNGKGKLGQENPNFEL